MPAQARTTSSQQIHRIDPQPTLVGRRLETLVNVYVSNVEPMNEDERGPKLYGMRLGLGKLFEVRGEPIRHPVNRKTIKGVRVYISALGKYELDFPWIFWEY